MRKVRKSAKEIKEQILQKKRQRQNEMNGIFLKTQKRYGLRT